MPQLELLKEKNYDVLFLMDDVDEFAMQMMQQYAGKHFRSISSGELDLQSEEEKQAAKEKTDAHQQMLAFLKESLGAERVADVKLSGKLKKHPVCLSAQGPLSIEMEKVLNAMPAGEKVKAQRVLELNSEHPVFAKLVRLYAEDQEKLKTYIDILYIQAQLMEGILPEDPAAYAEAICGLME